MFANKVTPQKLSLPGGDTVIAEVPKHLDEAMQEAGEHLGIESLHKAVLEREVTEFFAGREPSGDLKRTDPRRALKIAAFCDSLSRPILAAQALAIYAAEEARALAESDDLIGSLELLIEATQLTHATIPQADAHQARLLVRRLSELIAWAFQTGTALQSLDDIARVSNLRDLFEIAKVMWQPNLHTSLDATICLIGDLTSILRSARGSSREATIQLGRELARIRGLVARLEMGSCNRVNDQVRQMLELLDAWERVVQQHLIRLAQSSHGEKLQREHHELESQVKDQIGHVERELRALITRRYAEQYGKRWIERIQKHHERMYSNWMRILNRDKAAFRIYQEYRPSALEYAHLGDLIALITGEWNLFQEVFDFGYGRRNKSVFQDKMEHIIKVRNPLAHHRAVPRNELLRALVLCTDILKVMEASPDR